MGRLSGGEGCADIPDAVMPGCAISERAKAEWQVQPCLAEADDIGEGFRAGRHRKKHLLVEGRTTG